MANTILIIGFSLPSPAFSVHTDYHHQHRSRAKLHTTVQHHVYAASMVYRHISCQSEQSPGQVDLYLMPSHMLLSSSTLRAPIRVRVCPGRWMPPRVRHPSMAARHSFKLRKPNTETIYLLLHVRAVHCSPDSEWCHPVGTETRGLGLVWFGRRTRRFGVT